MSVEFLDTNILVYAHDQSAGAKRRKAAALVTDLIARREAALSIQVLLEFAVTVTRKISSPLPYDQVAEIIRDFSVLRIFAPEASDVVSSIQLADRYSISIWDALILRAAVAENASVIWTEDLNDGQFYEGVQVKNPFPPSP